MEFTSIEVQADGARGRLSLNRPQKLNPLSTTTLLEIAAAARWFDEQRAVKVVVVEGRGRAFSAGADLAAFAPSGTTADGPAATLSQRDAADAGRRMADAVEAMNAVTVARIQGHCVGGGVVLAAACDLRVAADTARFSIPEVDLGIPLAWGGIPRLVREIGPALTKELVMTCRPFGPEEARAMRFVNRVVPLAELEAEVANVAEKLASQPAYSLVITKRHVNAVAEEAGSTGQAFREVETLLEALRDEESLATMGRYLAARR